MPRARPLPSAIQGGTYTGVTQTDEIPNSDEPGEAISSGKEDEINSLDPENKEEASTSTAAGRYFCLMCMRECNRMWTLLQMQS
jgi:hypothetical protein